MQVGLRKGTGASWGYKALRCQQLGEGERVLDALLDEVTATFKQTPVEPGARVVLLREIGPTIAPGAIASTRGGTIRRTAIGEMLGAR